MKRPTEIHWWLAVVFFFIGVSTTAGTFEAMAASGQFRWALATTSVGCFWYSLISLAAYLSEAIRHRS